MQDDEEEELEERERKDGSELRRSVDGAKEEGGPKGVADCRGEAGWFQFGNAVETPPRVEVGSLGSSP